MFKEYLEQKQTVIYKILLNAFNNKKVSHAYLLVGEEGTPLIDLAKFIAKSYLCENDVLACEKCEVCSRIEHESYFDVHIIDGSNESIKDNMVKDLKKELNLTSLENNKSVYIINLIENATTKTVNSLLKFLEEPEENILAIITTNNIAKVLPTIISRCQLLRVKSPNKIDVVNNLVNEGIDYSDAFIASNYFSNINDIKNLLNSENFIQIKELAYKFYTTLINEKELVAFNMQLDISKILIKNKDDISLFLDILIDLVKDYYRENKVFKDSNDCINDMYDINKLLEILYLYQGKLKSNANTQLLLDSLCYKIMEVQK